MAQVDGSGTAPKRTAEIVSGPPWALAKVFRLILLARLALVASGLSAVVTEGGFSEPGSAKFTISASWIALVIPRSAKVKVRDCDCPDPASPNTLPLNRTPPLSTVLLPCPCKNKVVNDAPTPWPDSCVVVNGMRLAAQ
jgi:hypothetical protein